MTRRNSPRGCMRDAAVYRVRWQRPSLAGLSLIFAAPYGAFAVEQDSVPPDIQTVAVPRVESGGVLIAQASVSQPRAFTIPAGDLQSALLAFSQQADLQLLYSADITAALRTQGVQGAYTPEQALRLLLAGTGLTYDLAGGSTIVIERLAAQDRGPLQLQPITVTSQLQQRDLQETQASVAVFTGDELDQSTDTNIKDLFDRTANVYDAAGGLGLTIRGIEAAGIGGGGSGLLVDVNVDGASYVTAQGSRTGSFSTWDLGQVEILRGPQSTQQGRNALAGAISIRSKDPGFEREIKGRADYGRFDEHRLAAAVNVPIVDDKVALRISGEQFGSDGFIENTTRNEDDYARSELQTLRAKLRFNPTDRLDVILGHSYSDNQLGTARVNPALTGNNTTNTANEKNVEEAASNITNLRITYDLNPGLTVFSETTYLRTDYRIFGDSDGTAADTGTGERTIEDTNFSQEVRASYSGERLSGTIGVYYSDISTDLDFTAVTPASLFGFPPPSNSIIASNGQDTDVENYAVFGELDHRFADHWTVTLGARYDYEERDDVRFQTLVLDSVPISSAPPTESNATYSAFLPKAGLTYHWTDDVSTGFTIQRGYRSGGSGINSDGSFEFDEETTTNYELSFRSTWANDRLVVNANAFFTEWTDQQVVVPGPIGLIDGRVENAGESELYGFEVETEWLLNDNLNIFANLGFTRTRFVDFVQSGRNLGGNEFPFAPKWTGSLGGTYYFDNGGFVDLVGSFTDNVFETADNMPTGESDSFLIINGRVGYEADTWAAFVYARNLLDREYIERRRSTATDSPGEPRVIGVSVSARF